MKKYENLNILSENREKQRSYYIPEDGYTCLNGNWNFKYYDCDFEEAYEEKGWDKCRKCGSNLHAQKATSYRKSYPIYYCPNHKDKKCTMKDIKAEPLNKFVADALSNELKSRKELSKLFSQVNHNEELDILFNRLKGNKQALQNNLPLYEQCPSKVLKNKIEKLLEESKILHQRILEVQSKLCILDTKDTDKICNLFKNALITSDDLDVRNYIKKAVKSIMVDDNEVSLVLN